MADPIGDASARKGSAELLILAALEDDPLHGYDIAREITRKSGGLLSFHVASLYPLLYKLEDRKWIQGRWVEKPGQRRRRYYKLTAEGRRTLAAQRGRKAADVGRLAECLYALAGFAGAGGARIAEIDLNPIKVLPDGQGCIVVDALIVTTPLAQGQQQ